MKRRTILKAVGAGHVPFAGCATDPDSSTTNNPESVLTSSQSSTDETPATSTTRTRTWIPTPDYPTGTGDLETFDPEYTAEQVSVGSRDGVANPENNGPHDLRIWNASAASRSVEVSILDYLAHATAHDATYDLPADTALTVSLLEPSYYVVELGVADLDTEEALSVPRSFFDCNTSKTRIGIFENGAIKSIVITTAVLCQTENHSG